MKHLSQTLRTGLAALLILIAQAIMPAHAAFADNNGGDDNNRGRGQQVFCNKEGQSGKWKAQIGGRNTEHEYPLLANGQNVYVHDENDVTSTTDQQCQTLYGTKTIPIPATPAVNDPCGSSNATWSVPVDTESVHWTLNNQNHLIATAQTGYTFSNNQPTHDFKVAPETNTAPCIVELPKPSIEASDPCGANNATWSVPPSAFYTVKQNANRSVTLTANTGYIFDDGSANGVKSYTVAAPQDSGALCQSEPIPAPKPIDPCGLNNAYWVKPHDTATIDWSLNGGILTATAIGVLFQDGRSTISFGTATDSGALCSVKLPHTPDTDDPCGPTNATWDMPRNTQEYTWSLNSDGHLIATTTANYVFSNGQTSHDFGVAPDSNQPCPVTITQPTCDVAGSMTLVMPEHHFGNYSYEVTIGNGLPVIYDEDELPVTIAGIAQGATVHVKLIRDGFFTQIIFSKDYSFNILSCVEIPAKPAPSDPCGPANATWAIPENTSTVTWSLNDNDELIATAVGSLFTDGTSTHSYGTANDSNTLCAPLAPGVAVHCGLYNNDEPILPDSEHFTWSVNGDNETNTLIIEAIADEGYSFDEETQTIWEFVDEHTACTMPPLQTTPKTCHADATVTVEYDTERYYYTIQLANGEEIALDSGTTTLTEVGTYTVRGYEYRYGNDARIMIDQEEGVVFTDTFTVTTPSCEPGKGSITPLPSPIELPHTGSDGLSNLLIALVSAVAVYGAVYFAQPRRS